jgi:hypothetical protein
MLPVDLCCPFVSRLRLISSSRRTGEATGRSRERNDELGPSVRPSKMPRRCRTGPLWRDTMRWRPIVPLGESRISALALALLTYSMKARLVV